MNKDGNNKLIVKQKDLKEKKQSIGKHETRHEIGQKQIRTRRARGEKKRKFKWAKSATQT